MCLMFCEMVGLILVLFVSLFILVCCVLLVFLIMFGVGVVMVGFVVNVLGFVWFIEYKEILFIFVGVMLFGVGGYKWVVWNVLCFIDLEEVNVCM